MSEAGGSKSLTLAGDGRVILSGIGSYTGPTTVSAGTLQLGDGIAKNGSVAGNITDNSALILANPSSQTYAGLISGTGSLTKTGSGKFTYSAATGPSGSIGVNQGTLAIPLGLANAGGAITLASGATLEAGGNIKRAVLGNGIVTATDDLYIGRSLQTGQFNQGGVPGTGGTLNVSGNAVVLVSNDAAILGSQTNLSNGGSLTTLHGAQLGNPKTVDATKVLTAVGDGTVNGDFVNNGIVNGPHGAEQWLTFTQDVKGAGATTGNIHYGGSYSMGNSPAAVSAENVLLDPTSVLVMEIGGLLAGSQYDHLEISGTATLDGMLEVDLLGDFTPSAGQRFNFFDGNTEGHFARFTLPVLGNGLSWNTSSLYSTGEISVVPEPSTLALLSIAGIGLVGWAWRRRK